VTGVVSIEGDVADARLLSATEVTWWGTRVLAIVAFEVEGDNSSASMHGSGAVDPKHEVTAAVAVMSCRKRKTGLPTACA
jgi:hypothetical protein